MYPCYSIRLFQVFKLYLEQLRSDIVKLCELTLEEALSRQYIAYNGRLSTKVELVGYQGMPADFTGPILKIWWGPIYKNTSIHNYSVICISEGHSVTAQPKFNRE
jgi:hypothetical protein